MAGVRRGLALESPRAMWAKAERQRQMSTGAWPGQELPSAAHPSPGGFPQAPGATARLSSCREAAPTATAPSPCTL